MEYFQAIATTTLFDRITNISIISDMAKITAPIALSTVGAALGFSAEETRRMGLGGLCNGEHGRTSMWARYKPVRHPSLLPLTEQQRLSVAYGMAEPEGAV